MQATLLAHGDIEIAGERERSRRRYRRALLSSLSAGAAKAIGMAATLVTVPLTAAYLGPERFGLFMTVSSVPLLLTFADFGIGNGLLNALAAAHGRDDRDEAAEFVSSAFFLLLAVAGLFAGFFALAYPHVAWGGLFNVRGGEAVREAGPALAIFALSVAVNIPLGLVQRVQQGYQEGYITNLWLAAGSVLNLGLLLCFVRAGKSLPWLVAAVTIGPVLAGIANWITEFSWKRPEFAPRWVRFRWHQAKRIGSSGLQIFSSQAGAAVLLTAPVFLLGHRLGQEAVASYAVLQRVFWIFVVASALLTTPLWPAYGEALARGDRRWIRVTFARSLMANFLIVGLPVTVIALFSSRVLSLLTSKSVHGSLELAAATALLCFASSTRQTVSMMVNGCGYLRGTAIAFPIAAALAVVPMTWSATSVPDFALPLWVAGAELLVILVMLSDAVRLLRVREESPYAGAAGA